MILVATGLVLILFGAVSIRFPELICSLKKNDHPQWILLGSPSAHAFSKTIGVYSWVLEHGFESSQSNEVNAIGKRSLHRALFAKHALSIGVVLVLVGFVVALFGF